MRRAIAFAWVLALPQIAAADEQILTFDGEVPDDGLDHAFVEFEVPMGTLEIEVRHDDLSEANILDWGLEDPQGFRGWGGGNEEPAVVAVAAASRSYLTGAIEPGTWRVIIGKALVVESPATYHLEVVLRDVQTLAPQPERTPYVAAPALAGERRWYAGDLHVHSRESGDARPPLEEIAAFARSRGLDFVELSDHNVLSQLDFIAAAQADHPDLLLMPGMEFTTYGGHANAIGATTWVDHKIGQPEVTIAGAFAAIQDQGALVSINHPALALGNACLGCAWEHEIDPLQIDAVEIATTGLDQGGHLFDGQAIAFWDDLCDAGAHAAAVGGSDDHRAGVDLGGFQSPIGDPTTMVLADELSVAAILAAIRDSKTVVKLQGPDDPMVELTAAREYTGDTVYADAPVSYDVIVTGGVGLELRAVYDGASQAAASIDADPFSWSFTRSSPASGEIRTRVEIIDPAMNGGRRVVTSHIWQRACENGNCSDPSGGDESSGSGGSTGGTSGAADTSGTGVDGSGGTSGSTAAAADDDGSGGCGCRSGWPGAPPWWAVLLLPWRRRQRSGVRREPPRERGVVSRRRADSATA